MALINPFGRDLLQTGDWRPWALGTFLGVAVVGGFWLAASRGLELDGQTVIFIALASPFFGALALALKKGQWPSWCRWWIEALGFALVSPLFIVVWGLLIYPMGPWDFARPEKRS